MVRREVGVFSLSLSRCGFIPDAILNEREPHTAEKPDSHLRLPFWRDFQWQGKPEGGASTRSTLDPHLPVVLLDNCPGDG